MYLREINLLNRVLHGQERRIYIEMDMCLFAKMRGFKLEWFSRGAGEIKLGAAVAGHIVCAAAIKASIQDCKHGHDGSIVVRAYLARRLVGWCSGMLLPFPELSIFSILW